VVREPSVRGAWVQARIVGCGGCADRSDSAAYERFEQVRQLRVREDIAVTGNEDGGAVFGDSRKHPFAIRTSTAEQPFERRTDAHARPHSQRSHRKAERAARQAREIEEGIAHDPRALVAASNGEPDFAVARVGTNVYRNVGREFFL